MTVELKVKFPVKRLRRRHSLSQEALARRAGLSLRTVHRAETGALVQPQTALKLAAGLGLTLVDLLGADAPQSPEERELARWLEATGASESDARTFTGLIASCAPAIKRYLEVRGIL